MVASLQSKLVAIEGNLAQHTRKGVVIMKMSLALKRKRHFVKTRKKVYCKTLYFAQLTYCLDEYLKSNGF